MSCAWLRNGAFPRPLLPFSAKGEKVVALIFIGYACPSLSFPARYQAGNTGASPRHGVRPLVYCASAWFSCSR
ncbi:hypothetical protein F9C28_14540 [Shimwellia pseudoproteus]|uniref:hypothetical protein n=1 Tax=Shimwellia pseudoproteus TaxID=570012 RepID=UPI0018EBEE42|nr:hypothetical protein [Shimwellia pseudoproteus]MBJ3816113.1 hypothetical protein [Shimwellia pseudoproteus]